ncbi:MAG: choice-of-anchor Q domain-containing protein [Betaproteobacteria bacterium]
MANSFPASADVPASRWSPAVRRAARAVVAVVCSRLVVLLLPTVFGLLLQRAHAATIVVNSFVDGSAGCTLRKAVVNANAGSAINGECVAGAAGANTVQLPAGTHTLVSTPLNLLNRSVTITGIGSVIIDAQNLTRIFDNFDEGGGPASTAITISLQNLTLTHGNANSTTGDFDGGAAMYLEDNATATVSNVVFSGNTAAASGAAIFNNGALTIDRSTFVSNVANSGGEGGAIRNNGTLTVNNSTFLNNQSGTGGAIYHTSNAPQFTLNVLNSTFAGNTGAQRGGAIAANNPGAPSAITLTHVTITGNNSPLGGGIYKNQAGPFNIDRSIIAGNNGTTGVDCNGTSAFNSLNYNVIGNATGCIITGNVANNFTGAALLLPLANNGGPTFTVALQPYSPARDRAPTCASALDQRGLTRPVGLGCDSGAFEATVTVAQAPTIGTVTAGIGQATVPFTAPANNGGANITQYLAVASPGGATASSGTSPIIFPGLASGTSYTFIVRAINSAGPSADSAPSNSVTPIGLAGQPTGVSALAGNTAASISFTPPASNGGSPVTSYTAVANPGGLQATASSSPIVLGGLTNGTAYFFTVRANNGVGIGPASSPSNTVTPFAPVPPSFTSAAPPGGTINAAYNFTVTASGAPPPIFNVTTGALPPGLALATPSGVISGTPTTGGTFTGVITAGDGVGPGVTQAFSITIDLQAQSITFPSGALVVGVPLNMSATGGGSGNSITYASTTPSNCVVSGNMVTATATFICGVVANQAGNAFYNAAAPVTQTFPVFPGSQVIVFGAAPALSFGGSASVSATGGGSGNAVTFTSTTPAVCTISGATVTAIAVGTCTVAADQAGNANYNAATQATQSIAVTRAAQQIAFGAAPALVFGGNATVTATGGASGNPVTFTSTTLAVCTVAASTVTAIAAGNCVIAADQAGNTNYNAAPQVTQSFTIARADQQIVFGADPAIFAGSNGVITATGGASGNPVTFDSSTPAVCTSGGSNGATITGITSGNCTINANQDGDARYNAAPQATKTFAINPVPIAFTGNVYSRKTHGSGVGVQDLPLVDATINDSFTVEPRISESGTHQIVFRFTSAVNSVGAVSVTDASSAAVGTGSASFSANDLVITVIGVADNSRVTVSATGVNGVLNVSRGVGFLVGDVTSSHSVNAADISAIKARAAPLVDGNNFRFDVNLSGSIDQADVNAAKARSARTIP